MVTEATSGLTDWLHGLTLLNNHLAFDLLIPNYITTPPQLLD
jgi:hypothetical protein